MRMGRGERAITELMSIVELVSGMCKAAFGAGLYSPEVEGKAPPGLILGLVEEGVARGKVKEIYGEIREREAGRLGHRSVPLFWRAVAHAPLYLEAVWNRSKVLLAEGEISLKDKETLGLAVAANTGCHYFAHEHAAALRRLGVDDAALVRVLAVVDYFDGLNKLSEGMDIESDIKPDL
ncbi:MAG: carboxymuconolactone decarboxylase family protein [Nitrospinota bacterium]